MRVPELREGGEAMNREDFGRFGGSLTANVIEFHPDAIPMPDTLHIRMTRGERRIADELRKQFGGFERVIIDVDGERHEFDADSFIGLLESYEGASRWHQLFGTPERAARTLEKGKTLCAWCDKQTCSTSGGECQIFDYDALLEWLKGADE